jgi:hypothetical protein
VAVFKELDFRELRETVVAKIDGIKNFFFFLNIFFHKCWLMSAPQLFEEFANALKLMEREHF